MFPSLSSSWTTTWACKSLIRWLKFHPIKAPNLFVIFDQFLAITDNMDKTKIFNAHFLDTLIRHTFFESNWQGNFFRSAMKMSNWMPNIRWDLRLTAEVKVMENRCINWQTFWLSKLWWIWYWGASCLREAAGKEYSHPFFAFLSILLLSSFDCLFDVTVTENGWEEEEEWKGKRRRRRGDHYHHWSTSHRNWHLWCTWQARTLINKGMIYLPIYLLYLCYNHVCLVYKIKLKEREQWPEIKMYKTMRSKECREGSLVLFGWRSKKDWWTQLMVSWLENSMSFPFRILDQSLSKVKQCRLILFVREWFSKR